ncbi:hypothetical protein AB0I60_14610 [Actinosynnema sp. NPDC050436]|uniref:hypothetical protein n=1 Tax=Actinosynnema sp. NPDC050436 TaxID=3155659 RepID=UPI0033E7683F
MTKVDGLAPRPATRARQSPARGWLLRAVGWPAVFAGLALLLVAQTGAGGDPHPLVRPVVCALGGAALLAFGRRAVVRGRRHAVEVLPSLDGLPADRPVVLFLRSFTDDRGFASQQRGEVPLDHWGTTRTEEEQLAAALAPFGRMVALGQPGEPLPPPGASRAFASDEAWREQVLAGLDRARLVLLAAGPGESLRWEVEQVVAKVPAERVVLLVCRDAAQYRSFRAATGPLFPRGLPEYRSRSPLLAAGTHAYTRAVVRFEADWTPGVAHLDGRDAPGSARNWVGSVVARSLAEVYEQAGVRRPGRLAAAVRRRVRRPAAPVGAEPLPAVRIGDGRWRAERVRTGGVDFVVRLDDGTTAHEVEVRPSATGKTSVLVDGRRTGHDFRLGRGRASLVVGDDVRLCVDGEPVYALSRAAAGSATFLEHRATAIRDALPALPHDLPGPLPGTLRVAPDLRVRDARIAAGPDLDPVVAVLDSRADLGDARAWFTDRAVHLRSGDGVVVLPYPDLAATEVTADYTTLRLGSAGLDFPGHAERVAEALRAVRAAVLEQDSGFGPPPALHPYVRAGSLRAHRVQELREVTRWRVWTSIRGPVAGLGVLAALLAQGRLELGPVPVWEEVVVRLATLPAGYLAGVLLTASVVVVVDAVFAGVLAVIRLAALPGHRVIRRGRARRADRRTAPGTTPAPTAGRGGTGVQR